ncbi:MAG: formate-dependent phosphoribosylglycinamide formyltransferase [Sulfolobales archaeon]|nr:formate-dependent phosphoribosylglycinamide formyltransferase [Sulfolobales archaeon]MDW8082885.1 formate-dependent phosphoribosylglycinamide formyltransferase [Sulfolobales archaeon]
MKISDCVRSPMFEDSIKMLLLGSGELGKEVAIEAQRLGVEVVAVDRYDWAPAMHVAHRRYVIDMMNSAAVKSVVRRESPDVIIPEIEAISTDALEELESEGYLVVPNARSVKISMNRVELRKFASGVLGLPTTKFEFAENPEEAAYACERVGFPCLIKPEMSSSGHGHVKISSPSIESIARAYNYAVSHSRGRSRRVIVEEYVDLALEYTVLAYRHLDGERVVTDVCEPIEQWRYGEYHYIESWQPPQSDAGILKQATEIARRVADGLGGIGIFGVEVFLARDGRILFSEVAPRPHDTGLVTLITQELSEFAIHVRASLGLPAPRPKIISPGASVAIYTNLDNVWSPKICGLREVLKTPGVDIRVFGKPNTYPGRRIAVVLARGNSVEEALKKARAAVRLVSIHA